MAGYQLTQEAEADIAGIAAWSRARFGDGTRRRYVALIAAAILDVADDPGRVGHSPRPELGDEIRTWHLRLSRRRSTAGAVRQPRHVVVYRVEGNVVAILRVLHEAMDLLRHLDSTPDSEEWRQWPGGSHGDARMTQHQHPIGDHPRLDELRAAIQAGTVDTLIVAFTDMQGRLMGKRVTASAFLDGVIDHGAHVCTYLLGTDMEMNTPDGFTLMNWDTGYGDYSIDPDWGTLRILPWQDRTALVLGDVVDEETRLEVPVSPRTILKRQVAAAAGLGMRIKAGSEFEYYLLTDTYEQAARKGYQDLERFGHYNEDYHLLQATKAEPVHGQLRRLMTQARIPIEFSKGEAAAGQHEVNIRYDDVLESADRSVIFKHGAKEIAWGLGYGLTFMAKPDHAWTGSSGHLHMSAWGADDEALFFREGAEPYGMSDTMRWFLGGQMALTRELAIFFAPNINSYKRFAAASWAPVNVVWGRDNRTTGFRVVGHGPALHVECRLPGGDMNAYLTYAAFIGAGLYGVRNRIEPPTELRGNGYVATGCDRMPRALYEAIRALEESSAAVEILGQDVVDHYLNAARVEQQAFDETVHPWERERYLERS